MFSCQLCIQRQIQDFPDEGGGSFNLLLGQISPKTASKFRKLDWGARIQNFTMQIRHWYFISLFSK